MPLLIVDDSKSSLLALETAVRQFARCEIETFLNPLDALARTAKVDFDVVMVDYMMPQLNGIDVIRRLRAQRGYESVPIVMITSQTERAVRLEALEAGATDFLAKPFDPLELQARILNLMTLRSAQRAISDRARSLDQAFRHATEQADIREQEIIWCLAQAMASRDGNTGDHIERVANIAELIAEGLGLDRIQRRNIYLAAPLHDIGKIGIPDAILQKPGKLEPHEIAQMREHVPIGVAILRNSSAQLSRVATAIIGGHHEKWDGTGYPNGISGTDIPIEARIVAVADVFDALSSPRPYKAAWPLDEAYREIIACSGTHFDPACVAAFRRRWPAIRALFTEEEMAPTDEQQLRSLG